ncbi:MAG: helix-turn-helix transcriptional regulator [Chloroflexi bacterium]|nr:helix-turn-helix transcriptional regulator [Chloroflexota bacterium]
MCAFSNREGSFFVISVVSKLTGLHTQTLRYYERAGIVAPSRSKGNIRLYSLTDVERIKQVKTLIDDLGVNLAGVEVILRMSERMREMQKRMAELEAEVERSRQRWTETETEE